MELWVDSHLGEALNRCIIYGRQSVQCSAHLSMILFLSVTSFVPSMLSMGELPDVSGPYMVLRESKKCFISCLLA